VCGICGFLDGRGLVTPEQFDRTIGSMADSLASRGPDGSGSWIDLGAGVAFGHRRLAILDLSSAGSQPMISGDGKLVITFNGEIYNFKEIRAELKVAGCSFRGESDTEVLLEACRVWGVNAAVPRLNGIFAFALWNRAERTLNLVRDHVGVKPLYWGQHGNFFMFASQIKALRAIPGWIPEIHSDALEAFLQLGYVPGSVAIYRDIYKLLPGSILTWKFGTTASVVKYWDFQSVAQSGLSNQLPVGTEEATSQLENVLRCAVKDQMVSDVPLGAFLSGGIDSSTVVALMQVQSSTRVKTFSIGFNERDLNEAEHAKAVARHLGTDHTEFYCEPRHALEIIPDLPEWFDEPFADPSQIPTYLLSAMSRREVTVALTGDGGDELFAGYTRYLQTNSLYRATRWIPHLFRHLGGAALKSVQPLRWNALANALAPAIKFNNVGHKMHKLGDLLDYKSADDLCRMRGTEGYEPIVLGAKRANYFADFVNVPRNVDPISRLQIMESLSWLPEDVLAKVDRASMAVGLEARVPLLDRRVVEFAWRLPVAFKVRHNTGKWLLRKVLHRHVPPQLVEREKMGFGVPVGDWIRGPLRDWAEELLDQRKMRDDGILDPTIVHRRWAEHLSGARNWQNVLWHILMFQAWYRRWHVAPTLHQRRKELVATVTKTA